MVYKKYPVLDAFLKAISMHIVPKYYLQLIILLSMTIAFVFFTGCSSKESQLYTADEANATIMSAFLIKNKICGSNRFMNMPVIDDANKDDVDLCISEIFTTDCSVWNEQTSSITMCMIIQLDL